MNTRDRALMFKHSKDSLLMEFGQFIVWSLKSWELFFSVWFWAREEIVLFWFFKQRTQTMKPENYIVISCTTLQAKPWRRQLSVVLWWCAIQRWQYQCKFWLIYRLIDWLIGFRIFSQSAAISSVHGRIWLSARAMMTSGRTNGTNMVSQSIDWSIT